MANPEMDFGVKVGLAGFVAMLVGLLALYHAWCTPPPAATDDAPPSGDAAGTTRESERQQ